MKTVSESFPCQITSPVFHPPAMPSASAVFGSAKGVANAKGRAAADSPVTAVAISGCGHFGVCGAEDGRLFRYAMQSGLFRGEFVDKSTEVHTACWVGRDNL